MSKVVAATTAVVGGSSIALGGAYLVKSGLFRDTEAPDALEFDSLDKFKGANGGRCSKSLFGESGIDFSSLDNVSTTLSDGNNFFGNTPSADTDSNTKGCLIVNWEKKSISGTQEKGNGTFTGTGAFVNGDKGFVNFNVAKTKETGKQLDLTGGFYLLSKNTTTNNWEIKWKKEVTGDSNNKKVDSSDFATKFPKAKEGNSVIKVDNKDYGGFVDGVDKLSKIANDVDGSPTPENRKGSWSWKKTGGNGKIGEGSNDLEWWKHMYEESSFDLQTKLESFTGDGKSDNTQPKQDQ